MRIILSILFMSLFAGTSYATHPELVQIRSTFVAATQDLSVREALVEEVAEAEIEELYRMAYLGASKTLLAECGYSPWTKWSHFHDGKDMIEEAISKAPENAEFRYLRFLIQFNAPSFLDYDDDLIEDYLFVKKHLKSSTSDEVWTTYFESFCQKNADAIENRIIAKI